MPQLHLSDLFTVPVHPITDEPTEKAVPFQAGSHASWTGAVHATEARAEKIAVVRQLYQTPKTRQEVAGITGWPINSICSLTDALADDLEVVDYETIEWSRGKSTKRERLQVKKGAR